MGLIKFVIKSGVCIYALKYTVDEGRLDQASVLSVPCYNSFI